MRMRSEWWGRLLAMSLLVVACRTPVSAQVATGVRGVVADTTGRVATYVPVRVEGTGEERWQTETSDIGYYEMAVPPGHYRVRIVAEGFAPLEVAVAVRPGHVESVDLVLPPYAEPAIQVASAGPRDVVGRFPRSVIEWLPLPAPGRTMQSFLLLTPGIVVAPQTGTHGEFSVHGNRRLTNGMMIDGVNGDLGSDAVSPRSMLQKTGALPARAVTGSTETLIQFEAIEEVRITAGALTAESRRVPGALLSIVSRTGTNQFHGGAFLEGQPDPWAAKTWWENASIAPMRRKQYAGTGMSLGGPIVRDRLWFHVASTATAFDRATTDEARIVEHTLSRRPRTDEEAHRQR